MIVCLLMVFSRFDCGSFFGMPKLTELTMFKALDVLMGAGFSDIFSNTLNQNYLTKEDLERIAAKEHEIEQF